LNDSASASRVRLGRKSLQNLEKILNEEERKRERKRRMRERNPKDRR
jgi:hypothetical protein